MRALWCWHGKRRTGFCGKRMHPLLPSNPSANEGKVRPRQRQSSHRRRRQFIERNDLQPADRASAVLFELDRLVFDHYSDNAGHVRLRHPGHFGDFPDTRGSSGSECALDAQGGLRHCPASRPIGSIQIWRDGRALQIAVMTGDDLACRVIEKYARRLRTSRDLARRSKGRRTADTQ